LNLTEEHWDWDIASNNRDIPYHLYLYNQFAAILGSQGAEMATERMGDVGDEIKYMWDHRMGVVNIHYRGMGWYIMVYPKSKRVNRIMFPMKTRA
jgi:hypothetical protein